MFLQVRIIPSVHRDVVFQHAMGQGVVQFSMQWRVAVSACGGVCQGRCLPRGVSTEGVSSQGVSAQGGVSVQGDDYYTRETATEADGMHPTRMHSCFEVNQDYYANMPNLLDKKSKKIYLTAQSVVSVFQTSISELAVYISVEYNCSVGQCVQTMACVRIMAHCYRNLNFSGTRRLYRDKQILYLHSTFKKHL